jgi:hypothetical protein
MKKLGTGPYFLFHISNKKAKEVLRKRKGRGSGLAI